MGKIYRFKDAIPSIGEGVYLADGVKLIGDVELEDNVSIWFNSVVRGDVSQIKIGKNTNIQDLCMLHVIEEMPLIIGLNVSVGHSVTLHACTVGKGSLIGMNSCLLDGCEIGENSLVAAGSLVPPRKKYPSHVLIRGNPAKVIRELTEEEIHQYSNHYKSYVDYKNQFLDESVFSSVKKT
ncbi:MAG: gamma carbonic anhydrase family protein [Bacteriovoracaceae bacterium]